MIKNTGIKQHHLFSRIGAFLLLLIFLSVPTIEALHHHVFFCEQSEGIHHVHKESAGKVVTTAQIKCKLCDLITHHGQQAWLNHPETIVFNTTLLQTLNSPFILQASSSFVLACANKGPPAVTL